MKTELLILRTTFSPPPKKDGYKTMKVSALMLCRMLIIAYVMSFPFLLYVKDMVGVEINKTRKQTSCQVFFLGSSEKLLSAL